MFKKRDIVSKLLLQGSSVSNRFCRDPLSTSDVMPLPNPSFYFMNSERDRVLVGGVFCRDVSGIRNMHSFGTLAIFASNAPLSFEGFAAE